MSKRVLKLSIEDAQEIANVLASADNFCHVCAGELADQMQKLAPEHNWRKLVRDPGEDPESS